MHAPINSARPSRMSISLYGHVFSTSALFQGGRREGSIYGRPNSENFLQRHKIGALNMRIWTMKDRSMGLQGWPARWRCQKPGQTRDCDAVINFGVEYHGMRVMRVVRVLLYSWRASSSSVGPYLAVPGGPAVWPSDSLVGQVDKNQECSQLFKNSQQ